MMRAFWCAVAVLVLLGVWFVTRPIGDRRDDVEVAASEARLNEAADDSTHALTHAPTHAPTPESTGAPIVDGASVSMNESNNEPLDIPSAAPTNQSSRATLTSAAPDSAPTHAPAPDIDLLGEDGVRIAPPIPSATTPANAPSAPLPLLTDSRLPSEIIRRIDERTVELDGRFRVIGSGSESDPSRISWEVLTSANRYIDPSQGAMTAPPWVRLLDGTTIEISGYYSSALSVSSAKNLLLTLNRWDGCCIGLPPTPFDAIDISMRTPLPMRGLHLVRFGTFRGRLVVEPFATAGFLLGLYRLEDATIETK